MKNFALILCLAALVYLGSPDEAYAYINPGSGSDFFQMVMGFFAGILAGIKALGKKIKGIFIKSKERDYE